MKRYEFVDKIIAMIRQELEHKLPKEGTFEEMMQKALKIIIKEVK